MLLFPISSAKLFDVEPLPSSVHPLSNKYETVDDLGKTVDPTSPFGARIAHYLG